MSKFKTFTINCLLLFVMIILGSSALAVMPPAPYEWYSQRLGIPVPEGAKRGAPTIPEAIERDLALAAQLRPDNTDNLLIILVQFTDNPADLVNHPPQAYEDLLFSTGVIPTGSLVEYYQEISYGAFLPQGTVVAWITAPHTYDYYAYGNYGMGSHPNNSQGLLEDCVNQLDPTIDFSQFDNNGDGYAEGIIMVHAGPGGEETADPNDIWSHAWWMEVETDDGVLTGRYSIEPEEFLDGSMIAIGVFCHEYGHMLGMPDLYDYDGTSEGVGVYCLMSGGSWGALPGNPERPTHMCAELKYRLGWLTPVEVTGSLVDASIPAVETAAVCYKITHPYNPREYFLLENRAKTGFDSLLRGNGGLAIWHVDLDGWRDDETHPYVGLEQADGNWDLMRDYGGNNRSPRTNRGDAGDLYPGVTGNHYFSFSSSPNCLSYDLATAYLTVDDIQAYAPNWISADIYANPGVPIFRVYNVAVFDTVSGGPASNHNNEADAGETVDVVLSIYCDGASASNIAGTISSSDPRVSIVSADGQFAPVVHNSVTANPSDPFRIQVLSAAADSAVTFNLHFNADGQAYDTQFKMNINRQRILVVLDNNNSHWSDNLVSAMHRAGFSFDTLRQSLTAPVSYDQLIPYPAVLWTTASYFGRRLSGTDFEYCLTADELAVLKEYLDNAGRLGLFSQDYFRDVESYWFTSDYLHAGTGPQDMACTHIIGKPGTFMDGFDGHTREWTYYDYTDTVYSTGGGATDLEVYPGGSCPLMIQYPLTPQVGSYVTTFSGFGIERLEDAALVEFLSRWCGWILSNTNIEVPMPTLPVNGDTVATLNPTFEWTASASPGAASYTIQVAIDFAFTNILRDSTVSGSSMYFPGDLTPGTYFWRVKATPASGPATAYSPRSVFSIELQVICGDANGDGSANVGDAVFLISYVFKGGAAPTPLCAGDANGDGSTNVGDAVYMISYVFKGGAAPVSDCCP